MDRHQQRRLANFVVTRENMHNTRTTGLRCMVANHYMAPNGILIIEVEWQLSGLPNQTPEPYLIVAPEEVESLRSVWMVAEAPSRCAPQTVEYERGEPRDSLSYQP